MPLLLLLLLLLILMFYRYRKKNSLYKPTHFHIPSFLFLPSYHLSPLHPLILVWSMILRMSLWNFMLTHNDCCCICYVNICNMYFLTLFARFSQQRSHSYISEANETRVYFYTMGVTFVISHLKANHNNCFPFQ